MGGFISGQEDGFGIFEMWILRLGYFNARRSGADVFTGDALVFAYPDKPVRDEFRQGLRDYVEGGGHVLVIDSPDNAKSTANSLLLPFDLSVAHSTRLAGLLAAPRGWPLVVTQPACEVKGGTALATVDSRPVGAFAQFGKGTVTVIGFGSTFSDRHMGIMADVEPKPDLRQVFDLEYALIRRVVNDTLEAAQPVQVTAGP